MSTLEVKLTAPNGLEISQPTGLFINNEFVKAQKGETIDAIDPSNGKVIAKVQAADEEDVDIAVATARKAFKSFWKRTPGYDRGRLLNKLADLMERDLDLLTTIEAWDGGKAYEKQAKLNVLGSVRVVRYYAGFADKIEGKTIEYSPSVMGYTLREPLGVCGQIVPWNYPIGMAIWKIAPALAAGNTIVLKLSENTPLSMLHIAKLSVEAGFPAGVLNILNGYGRLAGAALASHMDVDKIAFTGSTATGKTIMKLASSNMKAVTLELGGKSPMIVFEDADLEKAVAAGHSALMANQGQTCTALSRYYVHESVHDKFVETYKAYIKKHSKVAHPFEEDSFHGPQISDLQHKKILEYIESGKSQGATVAVGGNKPDGFDEGYYVEPTLFTNVSDDMKIMREEIFGPVGCIATFKTEDEVVTRANDTEYGLGASIFTKDITRATRVAAELESGQVWINQSNTANERMPFGGYKSSGIGRELGEAGIEIYTQVKAVHVGLN